MIVLLFLLSNYITTIKTARYYELTPENYSVYKEEL